MSKIAIVGGTGDLGLGLAARLARNHSVTIGSRDASRASEAAARASSLSGAKVVGKANEEATRECEIAILAIPDLPSDDMLLSLKPNLTGKLVISPIVPMEFKGGFFSYTLHSGSATEKVASILNTRVAGAFHNVPAAKLLQVEQELEYDVVVTAESREVYEEAARVVSGTSRLRPLYGGPLSESRIIEAMTPVLLNVGKLNKIRTPSIRVV
jgi:8-hydroxy-5-deazaflavin:NADPH oxidoreductase